MDPRLKRSTRLTAACVWPTADLAAPLHGRDEGVGKTKTAAAAGPNIG